MRRDLWERPRPVRRTFFVIFLFAVAALALLARVANVRDVFVDGAIYFIDADCYSRMTRVAAVLEKPGTILRHHEFENYPAGIAPHTTAPLDYLIVSLKWMVDAVLFIADRKGTSVLRGQSADVAGAVSSVIFGVLTCLWIAIWAKMMERGAGRSTVLSGMEPRPWPRGSWAAAPLFFAVSPIVVHGTILGRPDHQALLLLVLAVALGAECRLARTPSRAWCIASGFAWGAALWVSLYEPLVLLVGLLVIWLVCAQQRIFAKERLPWLAAFAAMLLIAWLVEGWRFHPPDRDMFIYLANWNRTIGELRHLNPARPLLYHWLGWGCVASPVLLVIAMRHYRRAFPLLLLLLLVFALTCWQLRWGYFLALVFAMTLPWQLAALRKPWLAWSFFLVSLWPVAREWDARLFPDRETQDAREHRRADLVLLREAAVAMRAPDRRPFIAPWWMSPALAYWSRQPGIAGSSHESLPGIIDSARLYYAGTAEDAGPILAMRRVRYVLGADPAGIVANATALLELSAPARPFATLLATQPHSVAPFIQPIFSNAFYKVFEVDSTKLPP
jgi:hypothetical protein